MSLGAGSAVPNDHFWVQALRPRVRVSGRVQLGRVTVHPRCVVGVLALVKVAGFDDRRRVNGRRGVGPQDDSVLSGVRQRRQEVVPRVGGVRV